MGILVVPIPGACALIAALSASGVPCDVFTFAGFLPAKEAARLKKLEYFSAFEHTLVFYESTHRIMECIQDIARVFGEFCELVLAKEITKTHERFMTGTPYHLVAWLSEDKAHEKGEFVLIIPPRVNRLQHRAEECLSILLNELPLKQAVKLATQLTGIHKNELYVLALNHQKGRA
jgi:16S rRNA (cytidine1402-2'-O)-methyltransferase